MEPRGLRTRAVVTYLTPTEARMVEVARYLDGGSSPQPRSTWLLARAVERLQAHAATGSRLAAAALVELRLAYRLMGVPQDGRKPAKARFWVAVGLEALADLANRLQDTEAEAETRAALAALRAPKESRPVHSTMASAGPPARGA